MAAVSGGVAGGWTGEEADCASSAGKGSATHARREKMARTDRVCVTPLGRVSTSITVQRAARPAAEQVQPGLRVRRYAGRSRGLAM